MVTTLSEFVKKYPEVHTDPEKYLGPNFKNVLEFWDYVDGLSLLEREEIARLFSTIEYSVLESIGYSTIDAAIGAVGVDFRNAAHAAATSASGLLPLMLKRKLDSEVYVFGDATDELIGNVDNKVAYNVIMSYKNS
jgi:hypothetical protein